MDPVAPVSDSAAASTSSKLPTQPQNPALTNARNLHFSFNHVRPEPRSHSHSQQSARGAMGPPSNGPLVQRRQSLKRKTEDIHPDTQRRVSDQRTISLPQQRTSISQLSRQLGLGLKALSQSHASSSSQRISQRQQPSTQKTTQSQQPSTLPVAADTVPYFQTPSEIARSLHIASSQPVAKNASPEHQNPVGITKAPVHGQSLSRVATATNPNYQRPSEVAKSLHESTNQPLSSATTSPRRPRYQSLSEVASSAATPKQTITTTLGRSKKHSFASPLVSGGNAERFLNLITRQASEYSEWANATMRKEHIFRVAKPLATLVVIHISRSHGLQWCQCKVICSGGNQTPFDVKQARGFSGNIVDVEHPPRYGCASSLTPGAISGSGVRSERAWPTGQTGVSVSKSTIMSQEDSTYGLHKDMHSLHVISSQGSVFGHPMDDFSSQRQTHRQNLQQPDSHTDSVRYLKSSQGSEDEYEDNDGYIGYERTSLQANMLRNHTSNAKGVHAPIEEIENNEIRASDSAAMSTAVSNVSSIDDRLSDCGTQTAPDPQEFAQPAVELEVMSETTFTIVFSNLFNWSTLKVLDRVEIYDPCRSLTLPKNRASAGNDLIWIVERFKVV